jgi:hypothetical protein
MTAFIFASEYYTTVAALMRVNAFLGYNWYQPMHGSFLVDKNVLGNIFAYSRELEKNRS